MSMIYKGQVVESEVSGKSQGGTEQMRTRLLENVASRPLQNFAIHFSRPREIPNDVKNILYAHDLAEDPENQILANSGWLKFDHFVFVSAWQRDQYIMHYGMPYSKCTVIHNAIEKPYQLPKKEYDTIRFIYHTTPHRGLELLIPIFDKLTENYNNIHLDIYSSFGIYGWEQRDAPYEGLFNVARSHPKMTYHGVKPNADIMDALDKAHIFLFPSIWKETSCIAMIEAIRSGVLCIHPNFGALSETSANATVMYDYTENLQEHAQLAYNLTRQILDTQVADPNFIKGMTTGDRLSLGRHGIDAYAGAWNRLLKILDD